LITIRTTLIIRSHDIGFANLERHTYKRDGVVKPKPRRIEYYTLIIVSQWPKRRNTVRTLTLERLHVKQKRFCSVDLNAKTVQF
jgi:hypothetical protein